MNTISHTTDQHHDANSHAEPPQELTRGQAFGKRLRELRTSFTKKKLTQSKFAEWMGVRLRVEQSYEKGQSWPGTDKIQNLLVALDKNFSKKLNTDWLLLGKGEKFLRSEMELIDQYALGAAIVLVEGEIVDVSDAAADILQLPAEEIVGKPSFDFLTKASKESIETNVPDGYERPYGATIVTGEGDEVPVLVMGRNTIFHGESARLIQLHKLDDLGALNQEAHDLLSNDNEASPVVVDYLRGRRAAAIISQESNLGSQRYPKGDTEIESHVG